MHGKQQDQQDRKPEVGNGNAQLGQAHHTHVANLVVVRCCVHPCGQRQHRGQCHGHQRERHGQRKAFQHQFRHGGAVGITEPHVTPQQPADPEPVTLPGRLVEPELGRQRRHSLG